MLDYNVSIPYEAWMSGGDLKLYLDQSKIGYHKSLFLGRIRCLWRPRMRTGRRV